MKIGKPTIKIIYNVLGIISLLIGAIGIILPILPTTPFILLSAACFCKGSNKLHDWLLQSRVFGPIIKDYEEKKGIEKKTKIKAISIMWFAVIITILFFLNTIFHIVMVISVALIGTLVMLRIKSI